MTQLTRRTLLGALGASVLLAGCRAPWQSSTSPAATTPSTSASADVSLVRRAISEIEEVRTALAAPDLSRAPAQLRSRLEAVHAVHLAALDTAVASAPSAAGTTSGSPSSSPSGSAPSGSAPSVSAPSGSSQGSDEPSARPVDRAGARRRLLARESELLAELARLAGEALDPTLARLMASMAAGLAQHLHAADPEHALASASGPAPSLSPTDDATEAVQDVLAGQHAALYVGGVLAARTSASGHPDLRTALFTVWAEHRDARDQLEAMVRAGGVTPVAAGPEYAMPGRSGSAAQVMNTAALVERRCTGLWGALVGHTAVGELREWAIARQRESAVREVDFGGNPVAFPDAAQLTNR